MEVDLLELIPSKKAIKYQLALAGEGPEPRGREWSDVNNRLSQSTNLPARRHLLSFCGSWTLLFYLFVHWLCHVQYEQWTLPFIYCLAYWTAVLVLMALPLKPYRGYISLLQLLNVPLLIGCLCVAVLQLSAVDHVRSLIFLVLPALDLISGIGFIIHLHNLELDAMLKDGAYAAKLWWVRTNENRSYQHDRFQVPNTVYFLCVALLTGFWFLNGIRLAPYSISYMTLLTIVWLCVRRHSFERPIRAGALRLSAAVFGCLITLTFAPMFSFFESVVKAEEGEFLYHAKLLLGEFGPLVMTMSMLGQIGLWLASVSWYLIALTFVNHLKGCQYKYSWTEYNLHTNATLRSVQFSTTFEPLSSVLYDLFHWSFEQTFFNSDCIYAGRGYKYRFYWLDAPHPLFLAVKSFYEKDRNGTIRMPTAFTVVWNPLDQMSSLAKGGALFWLPWRNARILSPNKVVANVGVGPFCRDICALKLPKSFKDYRSCAHCGKFEMGKRRNCRGKRISSFQVCRLCKQRKFHKRWWYFACHYCSDFCMREHWPQHKLIHKKPKVTASRVKI